LKLLLVITSIISNTNTPQSSTDEFPKVSSDKIVKNEKLWSTEKMKISMKQPVDGKRQKKVCSKITTIKGWLKCWAEIFTKGFWFAFFEKYGPRE